MNDRRAVPGTGRLSNYSRGYRAYRINISMRAAEAALEDDLHDWEVRHLKAGRVRAATLPQVWDDVPWRCGHRSWKEHRRSQWK